MLPIPKGFASSGPDCSEVWDAQRRTRYQLSGRAGNTRQFLSVGSAAFPREERGCRASPEHNPSLGMLRGCRTCQDMPASLAEGGSHLINRFQTLQPLRLLFLCFQLLTPPPSCNSCLTSWAWARGRPRACRRGKQGNLVCLPLVFFLPVQP